MFQDLKNNWERSSYAKKAILVGGVAAIVLIFVAMLVWSLRDDYQVLFAELDPQDAAQMVAELDRAKIHYKLAENGSTILVDKDLVYKTRLKLMSKGGNLKGNVGFELFNSTDYGTTEFAQKINFQRALQGELARTIMAIDEVKHARVLLVLPESGLFKKQGARAKSSVNLTMKGNAQLAPEQVLGIQRIVAASVADMEATAVTVLDQRGVALSKNVAGDSVGATTASRMEIKKEIESYFSKKVSSLLDAALGAGAATAVVDVVLNFDQLKVTTEDVLIPEGKDGQGAVLKRRQTEQGNALSIENNTGKTQTTEGLFNDAASSGSRTIEIEYQNGRRVEQTVVEPGNIQRISVGIFVPAEVSEKTVSDLKSVIGSAIGLDIERGDSIAINTAPISETSTTTSPTAEKNDADGVRPMEMISPKTDKLFDAFMWLVALIAVIGLFVAIYCCVSARNLGLRELSADEREKMLAQIADWVGAPISSQQQTSERT